MRGWLREHHSQRRQRTMERAAILNVTTLVRMPVVKMLFNVCCCHKHTFVVVTEANAPSLRKEETKKVSKETKTVIEGCLPKAATKGRKNPARNQ